MELLKDYDCDILYHPRKANRVADVLSRMLSVTHMMIREWTILEGIRDSEFKFEVSRVSNLLTRQIPVCLGSSHLVRDSGRQL